MSLANGVVLTFGVWDLLHVGHIRFLERAVGLGKWLVVGVPTDDVVIADKGKPPVIPFEQRIEMVEAVRFVWAATEYSSLDFRPVLNLWRPAVLAVGEQWGSDKRHRDAEEWVKANGAKKVVIPYTLGISTTDIINRISWR